MAVSPAVSAFQGYDEMTGRTLTGIFQSVWKDERIRFWLSVFFIIIVGLTVIWGYHPFERPVRGNGVYFMYMGQSICRGDTIYRMMACGYPPLVPLVNAACMTAGHWVSVPSYISPKPFAVVILLGSFLLMFLVTRIYTGRIWVGVLAALMLMDFPDFLKRGTLSLEPKILVLFLTLAAVCFLQKEKWLLCGVMLGLAATCYQPSLMWGFLFTLVAYRNQKKSGEKSLLFLVSGFVLGLLPSIFYLLVSGQVHDFLNKAVLLKLISKPRIPTWGYSRFFTVFLQATKDSLLPYLHIFILSFILNLSILLFRRNMKRETGFFLPRFGGIVFLTFGWMVFNYLAIRLQLKFLGLGDFMLFYFLIAFWSAWGVYIVYTFFSRWLKRWPGFYPIFRYSTNTLFAISVFLMTFFLVQRSVIFKTRFTLADQIRFTEKVLPGVEESRPILALAAPEIYVLTGRRNPWRYFNLWQFRYFDTIIEKLEPEGCDSLLKDIYQQKFPIIVVGKFGKNRKPEKDYGCFGKIIQEIESRYHETDYKKYRVFRLETLN